MLSAAAGALSGERPAAHGLVQELAEAAQGRLLKLLSAR